MKDAAVSLLLAVVSIGLFSVRASSNAPPTADAGPDTTFIQGLTYGPRGTATDDSLTMWDLIHTWRQIGGPVPGVEILAPESRNSSLVITQPGAYVFELTVSDSELSAKDTIAVTVLPAIPFLVLTPDTGDTIYTGTQYVVTWKVYPPTGMHVFLSTNDGLTYERLNLTKVDLTDTFFVWEVSDTLPESDECIIEVSEYGHHEIVTYSGRFHLRAGSNNAIVPRAARMSSVAHAGYALFTTDGGHLGSWDPVRRLSPRWALPNGHITILRGADASATKKVNIPE